MTERAFGFNETAQRRATYVCAKQGGRGDGGDAVRADIGDARCLPLIRLMAPPTSPSKRQEPTPRAQDAIDAKDETNH